jgi:hypothetical protein
LDSINVSPADFHTLLIAASFLAMRFAKQYVTNNLPVDAFEYRVSLNQSHDGVAGPDFPSDDARTVEGLTERQVVDLLCRDGACPEWIDVCVEATRPGVTVFRLVCCGRYTADRRKMYYNDRGLGPFGVKSPDLPPGFRDGQRFPLTAS